ncbi:TPA: hypothetical protein QC364_000834 [Bacillus cereus]|uniref:hypothetical protein n=1 Tax=Bacillus paranthracis TaxID=2026186 RepID=UPI0032F8E97E|nr:hypothetical protein [Bacillus cereus]
MLKFEDLSGLQSQLKSDIMKAIVSELYTMCEKVVLDNLNKLVYEAYIPQGDWAYDRTMDLLNSVTVGNLEVGTKIASFEVYMDATKIHPHVTDDVAWNQHASIDPIDVSEFIPMWVEDGTHGSLWDREGAHYMEQSYVSLDSSLTLELAKTLREHGWNVTEVI